jgi:hypothetical protein
MDLPQVLKLKCCKTFINNDLFWKNKMRCNYPLSFIDDLLLWYYKKLYRTRAQNDLRQLEHLLCETDYVLHPHIKVDLTLLGEFQEDRVKVEKARAEVKLAQQLYSIARDKLSEEKRLYSEKISTTKTKIHALHDCFDSLHQNENDTKESKLFSNEFSVAYKYYEINVKSDDESLIRLKQLHPEIAITIDHSHCYRYYDYSLPLYDSIADLIKYVNETYGPTHQITLSNINSHVDRVVPDHGVGIGFRFNDERIPKFICWLNLNEGKMIVEESLRIPRFICYKDDDHTDRDKYKRLYNVQFDLRGYACSCDSSCDSSHNSPCTSDSE